MSKLSDKQLKERRKRMQEEALKSVVKTEQLNIRIDENSIRRLYDLAVYKNSAVGTMVREWIIDRLKLEESRRPGTDPVEFMMASLSSLHDKIDHWTSMVLRESEVPYGEQASSKHKR